MTPERLAEFEAKLKAESPESYAHLMEMRNPGLPPIDQVPRPGDVIRSNMSPCECVIEHVSATPYGLCFACRVLDPQGKPLRAKAYFNGYDLEGGRLLHRLTHSPEVTGWNVYNLGRDELFVLRRPWRAMPIGRKECQQAQGNLFA